MNSTRVPVAGAERYMPGLEGGRMRRTLRMSLALLRIG